MSATAVDIVPVQTLCLRLGSLSTTKCRGPKQKRYSKADDLSCQPTGRSHLALEGAVEMESLCHWGPCLGQEAPRLCHGAPRLPVAQGQPYTQRGLPSLSWAPSSQELQGPCCSAGPQLCVLAAASRWTTRWPAAWEVSVQTHKHWTCQSCSSLQQQQYLEVSLAPVPHLSLSQRRRCCCCPSTSRRYRCRTAA